MARSMIWLIDMGDGTWAVSAAWPAACRCTAAPRPRADRACRRPLLRTRRSPSAADRRRPGRA